MTLPRPKFLLFDWGDTLMSEDGPQDVTMADWPTVQVMEGAQTVLAALARNSTLAVATNATVSKRRDIVRALERAGLAEFISDIFCYTEIGSRKDEVRFWQVALARLGARPDETVMIGDSLEQDVRGARKAGVAAIWFNWRREPRPSGENLIVIHQLHELLAMFGEESDSLARTRHN